MGLDSVGTDIYDIHKYFRRLTVDDSDFSCIE